MSDAVNRSPASLSPLLVVLQVHIAGYFVPEEMEESMDEEDEDDDEDMMDQLYAYHGALGSGSEDEDEEEDDDSDDSQDEGEDGRRLIPASRVQIQVGTTRRRDVSLGSLRTAHTYLPCCTCMSFGF